MRPLQIGLFTDFFLPDYNGVVTSVCLLSDELRARGHEVHVVCPDFPNYQDDRKDVHRISSVQYAFLPTYRMSWPGRRHFDRPYDIIHTQTPLTLGLAGVRLARKWNIPHVATYHTHLSAYTHYVPGLTTADKVGHLMPRFISYIYGRADAVITPTAGTLDTLHEAGVKNPVVIPTSIDPRVLESAPPVASPWPEGRRRILSVGRMAREKRFDLVIEAISRMPDAHLVLIGEGPDREQLETHAQRLGVRDRVTFLGVRPWTEVGAYYKLAELFLFASDTETQGLVLQEAQLMGLPVVAVGARGTLTGVESGYSGYLVPVGDIGGLVRHTRELLDSPFQMDLMSANAREFGSRTTPSGVAGQVMDVYERVLNKPRPRRKGGRLGISKYIKGESSNSILSYTQSILSYGRER